jgi:REP element-mobilizing transposase RayT
MQDGVCDRKNVEQPPSAVLSQDFQPKAKPAKNEYRRNLPHLQAEDKPIYLTFCTYKRWHLPEPVRSIVIRHCLHDHGTRLQVHGLVVMPDHVHVLFSPLIDKEGNTFSLAEITNGIKGASAHSINKVLNRKGPVWQSESFDHLLRSDEKIREKVEYICQNPVRKGLVEKEGDYFWLWREWVDGDKNVEEAPSPALFLALSAETE